MERTSGKQRRYLRGQGNPIKPTVYLGKDGISDALLNSLKEAFNNRELVKVRIEKSCELERKEAGRLLAQAACTYGTASWDTLCYSIDPTPDNPEIKLP